MNEKHYRFEFKYRLDPVKVLMVKEYIKSIGLVHDSNALGKEYFVTSLYFDTFGIDDYYDKSGGFLNRKKVRARIYGKDLSDNVSRVYLETKHKHDMYISKDRDSISVNEWREGKTSDMFNANILSEGRVPICVVRYKREAFNENFFSRVRLTFDYDIEAVRNNSLEKSPVYLYDTIPVSDPYTIMEIKFNDLLPWWFGVMVRKFNLKRGAYSKYSSSLDALYSYNPLPR